MPGRTAGDARTHVRYTALGEPNAEEHVHQDLARLTTGIESELGDTLSALLLCGPFARGEGRVLQRDGEPHADAPGYQLIAVLRRRPERYARALATISATWTRLLRSHVWLCGVTAEQLAAPPATRSWFHAGAGQLVTLSGDASVAGSVPRLGPTRIAADEFAYVLCEGLVALALCELESGGAAEPLARALRWAVLGCGDALLLRRGLYAPTLSARKAALAAAHAPAALRALYADAADPHAPRAAARDGLEAARRTLTQVFLNLEAERAGTRRDVLGYVGSSEPLLRAPERSDGATARALAVGRWLLGSEPRRHPLEGLLRASTALALGPHVPACRIHATQWLAGDARAASPAGGERTLAEPLRALAAVTLIDPLAHPWGGWMLYRPSR
jgi:hypothetical protein